LAPLAVPGLFSRLVSRFPGPSDVTPDRWLPPAASPFPSLALPIFFPRFPLLRCRSPAKLTIARIVFPPFEFAPSFPLFFLCHSSLFAVFCSSLCLCASPAIRFPSFGVFHPAPRPFVPTLTSCPDRNRALTGRLIPYFAKTFLAVCFFFVCPPQPSHSFDLSLHIKPLFISFDD